MSEHLVMVVNVWRLSRKEFKTMPHVKLNGFVVLIARAMSMVVKKFERR